MKITLKVTPDELKQLMKKECRCEQHSLNSSKLAIWEYASAINHFSNKLQTEIAKNTDELFGLCEPSK